MAKPKKQDVWNRAGGFTAANGDEYVIEESLTRRRYRVRTPAGKLQPAGSFDKAWKYIMFSAGINPKTHRTEA